MRTSDFDYELPRELIATHPAQRRDESRLLVVQRDEAANQHRVFRDLAEYLRPGDLLVMNDSRVMKARLRGSRASTGAGVELLLLSPAPDGPDGGAAGNAWVAMCKPARKVCLGETIVFGNGAATATVIAEGPAGERTLRFSIPDIFPLLDAHGEIPLPPYIVQRRKETDDADDAADPERYQTVYAREQGSVAAPTAGLHFTPELLGEIERLGVNLAWVTLHVGAGTFKPVEVDNPAEHPIHSEMCEVPPATADAIARAKAQGGRVVAVGTTTVRTLESAWDAQAGHFRVGRQSTRLLILPGYRYNVVDVLVTNFHLPRSSLMMMVSALAGTDRVMQAYREAIENGYRFYSYGDAMLII